MIGPINPSSQDRIWVKVITLKMSQWGCCGKFQLRQRECRFDIHDHLLSDIGTLFVNIHVWRSFNNYRVDLVKSIPYYPQGDGEAEATNKTASCSQLDGLRGT